MTPIEKIPHTWCAMWSDDPALAHDLLTPDGRQWSGTKEGLDAVVGPAATQAFIERYRVDRGIRFAPRTLVIDGPDRLAYTWDATLRDGTVLTGTDVCVLRAGKVAENWTIPGTRQAPEPDVSGSGDASRAEIAEVVAAWTPVWDGATHRVADLVTPEFTVWLGANPDGADDVVGPDAFAAHVERFRSTRSGLRFAAHRDPVIDVERQTAALTWSATAGGRPVAGGVDVLALHGGRIAKAWSIVGTRPFRY